MFNRDLSQKIKSIDPCVVAIGPLDRDRIVSYEANRKRFHRAGWLLELNFTGSVPLASSTRTESSNRLIFDFGRETIFPGQPQSTHFGKTLDLGHLKLAHRELFRYRIGMVPQEQMCMLG